MISRFTRDAGAATFATNLAVLASGNLVLTWADGNGLHGQIFTQGGSAVGNAFLIDGSLPADESDYLGVESNAGVVTVLETGVLSWHGPIRK